MSESENEPSCSNQIAQIKRKKRSANFTPNETILLMSLISDFKNVLENKKTDGVSMQEKNKTWKKITNAFNSACPEGRHRETDSLKKLYDNKKREVRKDKAEERKEVLLTGGGISTKKIRDPAQELILSIVDPLSIVGGTSLYGSDSLPLNNVTIHQDDFSFELENLDDKHESENKTVINEEKKQKIDRCELEETGWKKGSDLLRPISTPLKRPREELPSHSLDDINVRNVNNPIQRPLNRRRPTETVVRSLASNQLAEKYNILADKKNLIADYTLKKIKKEIEQSNEEHNMRMKALKLDIEIKTIDIQIKKQQIHN
ncbi:unnamed protein product [Psylliodes chrysocephalus]|uniref:Regulatory protein zeste n=1 Tax=Psylliodes chrysocephalus TaxID=3402493 RepID=A0A9P0CQ89_9CUCU|nr:unnamed protein product [Psylliodes chrysocephala]